MKAIGCFSMTPICKFHESKALTEMKIHNDTHTYSCMKIERRVYLTKTMN